MHRWPKISTNFICIHENIAGCQGSAPDPAWELITLPQFAKLDCWKMATVTSASGSRRRESCHQQCRVDRQAGDSSLFVQQMMLPLCRTAKEPSRTRAFAPGLYNGNDDAVAFLAVAFGAAPRQLLKHMTHHKLDVTANRAAARLLLRSCINTQTHIYFILYPSHSGLI